ncbi:hypothetical protein RND71_036357 [Anisodus tanguticus]|uniref:Uncharacterized protein n=1 Tax=Anisodus tanguticus TaxID=243964 RepID=A0AAE1R1N8_9SOLA|nr:hypothetical protein RND71_036357 [Anisodus tanguticus]
MAVITSITMNFHFISTHNNYHNISSNPTSSPLCITKSSSSSSVRLIWLISSNSLHHKYLLETTNHFSQCQSTYSFEEKSQNRGDM